jgi:homoserine kinase type II
VFPWVKARSLCPRALSEAQAEAAGTLLAQLHAASANSRVVRFDRYALGALRDRLAALPSRLSPEVAAAVVDIDQELDHARLTAAARSRLPAGLIHQDVFVDNVLIDDDDGMWILDFEQAAPGPWVYDLAVTANAWGYDEALVLPRLAALIHGYQRLRPLGQDERAAFAQEARRAAARFCLTRITDVELDPRVSAKVRRRKDFRRYHDRLRAWRTLPAEVIAQLF